MDNVRRGEVFMIQRWGNDECFIVSLNRTKESSTEDYIQIKFHQILLHFVIVIISLNHKKKKLVSYREIFVIKFSNCKKNIKLMKKMTKFWKILMIKIYIKETNNSDNTKTRNIKSYIMIKFLSYQMLIISINIYKNFCSSRKS